MKSARSRRLTIFNRFRSWGSKENRVLKNSDPGYQKGLRCEAREESTSGGVLIDTFRYVEARRSGATKQVSLSTA
jgi:hypothetical protein